MTRLHGHVITGCDLHENQLCMITVRIRVGEHWYTGWDGWSSLSDQAELLRVETVDRLAHEALRHTGYRIHRVLLVGNDVEIDVTGGPDKAAA